MNFSLLIPDASEGEALVFYLVNCISQIKEIDIYIMSNVKNHQIKHSSHIKHFSYYPKNKDETIWISNINNMQKKYDISLVMPISGTSIKTIIKNRDLICFKDRLCLMPSYKNFNTADNRVSLSRHMVENKISCPRSFLFDKNDLNNNKFSFPVLIKASEGTEGGKGIHKVYNIKEIVQFSAENDNFINNYLIEEFIEGFDLSCNVLCKNGEILVYTIQKGILFDEVPFTSPIGVKFLFDARLLKEIKRLMKSLEWSGIANIDVRYDSSADNFKILEINPRFWGSLNASLAAGVNFPFLYCLLSLGQTIEKQEYSFIEYLKFKGLVKAIKNNKSLLLNFSYILKNSDVRVVLNDPKLYMYKLYFRLISFFKNKKIRFIRTGFIKRI